MNFANIRLLNVTHSAASFVQTDDLESFVRAQKGLQSHLTDWVDISRGLGAEEPDSATNATRGLATHEMVVRAQYEILLRWKGDHIGSSMISIGSTGTLRHVSSP